MAFPLKKRGNDKILIAFRKNYWAYYSLCRLNRLSRQKSADLAHFPPLFSLAIKALTQLATLIGLGKKT